MNRFSWARHGDRPIAVAQYSRRQVLSLLPGVMAPALAACTAVPGEQALNAGGSPMLKIMLVSRRHPDLSRPQFFDHLANAHASLVKSVPEFTKLLKRYVQNHTRLAGDGVDVPTTYRRAIERDSVIELWFDDADSLHKALSVPRYVELIRPDEARFNDLTQLVVLATVEETVQGGRGQPASFKAFDVIRRRADIDRATFAARWKGHVELLKTRPAFRDAVRKIVINRAVPDAENPFGQPANFDGVAEYWFDGFAAAAVLAGLRTTDAEVAASEASCIDVQGSFSVLAVENPVINPPPWTVGS